MMKKKLLTRIIIISVLLLIATSLYFSFRDGNNYFDFSKRRLEYKKRKVAWNILEGNIKKELACFKGDAGIIIKDLSYGWQINLNQNDLFASASLVKIPIMAACFWAVSEGKLSLEENLQLKNSDKVLGSGSLKSLPSGKIFSVKELIEIMIKDSDNTAANMLIKKMGFDYLNACFQKMGLKNTNISRKMMDFRSRRKGKENFTNASDLAFLLEEIYDNKLINKNYSQICLEFLKKQSIRDRIPSRLPLKILVAHKTGLERGVCHDVGIIFSPRVDILICVLTKHRNKTAKIAKNFIAQIAFLAYSYAQSF